jgi:hypothetical protein
MVSRAFYDLSDCLLSSGGYKINLIVIVLRGIRWQANNNNNNNIVVFVCIEVCLSAVQILKGFPFFLNLFLFSGGLHICPTLLYQRNFGDLSFYRFAFFTCIVIEVVQIWTEVLLLLFFLKLTIWWYFPSGTGDHSHDDFCQIWL